MEAFEKTEDLFEYLSKYHQEIKNMFKEEKSEINRKRVQLLLDYLVRHEKRYEEAMRQAEKEPSGSEEAVTGNRLRGL